MLETDLEKAEVGQHWKDENGNIWQVFDVKRADKMHTMITVTRAHQNADHRNSFIVAGNTKNWEQVKEPVV